MALRPAANGPGQFQRGGRLHAGEPGREGQSGGSSARRPWRELAEQARGKPTSAKIDRLLRLLGEYPDKLVLFTQFRATQDLLDSSAARRPGITWRSSTAA